MRHGTYPISFAFSLSNVCYIIFVCDDCIHIKGNYWRYYVIT